MGRDSDRDDRRKGGRPAQCRIVFARSEQKQRPKGALECGGMPPPFQPIGLQQHRPLSKILALRYVQSGVMPPHSKAAGAAWFMFVRFGSRPQKQMVSQKLCGIGRDARAPGQPSP